VKTETEVREGCCLSLIIFNQYGKYLTNEAPEEFRNFKMGGKVIHTVKYAYYLVVLAEEVVVPRGYRA
jgi:hypothetical protein